MDADRANRKDLGPVLGNQAQPIGPHHRSTLELRSPDSVYLMQPIAVSSGWVSAIAASVTAVVGLLAYLEVRPRWFKRDAQRPKRQAKARPSKSVILGALGVSLVVTLVAAAIYLRQPATDTASKSSARKPATPTGRSASASKHQTAQQSATHVVTLSLHALAPVYVCLMGDNGDKLIAGRDLQPGESTPTYHATRFAVTLGNDSVVMYINGIRAAVAQSRQAIGYEILDTGIRQQLTPSSLPTCT
jgi:hypothetical protein